MTRIAIKNWIAGTMAAVTLLWAFAAPAQAIPAASPPFPPLFVDCRGERTSSPTVILEAGAFGTSADWDFVLDDLAVGGRVCARFSHPGKMCVFRQSDDREEGASREEDQVY